MDDGERKDQDLGPVGDEGEPSPVPELARAEYDDIAEKIRWFSRLTVSQKLRAAAHFDREDASIRRFREVRRGP